MPVPAAAPAAGSDTMRVDSAGAKAWRSAPLRCRARGGVSQPGPGCLLELCDGQEVIARDGGHGHPHCRLNLDDIDVRKLLA